MRFAWLRETEFSDRAFPKSAGNTATMIAYNLVWWIPVVLPFTKVIDYHSGFIAFFFVTMFRALANAYRINVLSPARGSTFPLRTP